MGSLPFCERCVETAQLPDPQYPKTLLAIGDHIRKVRLDRGLLQKDVAVLIGTDTTSIFNWEGGYHQPSFKFYPKIIEFLGYNPIPEPEGIQAKTDWLRQSLGLSLNEVAREMGIDLSTLRTWFRSQGISDVNAGVIPVRVAG